jgi:hypothetical protein
VFTDGTTGSAHFDNPMSLSRLAPGSTAVSRTLTVADDRGGPAAPTANTVSATIAFSDDTGATGSATMSASIARRPAPVPPPTTNFALTGHLTDGTSGGALPNITVQITSGTNAGKSAVTDSSGNYVMSSLSAGTFTLSVAAVGYQTTTQQVTLSANTRVDLVLQRASTPPISPIPASCNAGPYTWDANPNVLRCRNRLGQFAPSVCCGR